MVMPKWLWKSQAKLYLNFRKDIINNDRFIKADIVIDYDETITCDIVINRYGRFLVNDSLIEVDDYLGIDISINKHR